MTLPGRNRNAGMPEVSPTGQGLAPEVFESPVALRPANVPAWPCLCGARNRLRDTTCRHCGTHKP